MNITAGEHARLIGSKTCIRGELGLDLAGSDVNIIGRQSFAEYSAINNLKALLNGDFVTLLEGIAKVCK